MHFHSDHSSAFGHAQEVSVAAIAAAFIYTDNLSAFDPAQEVSVEAISHAF